MHAVVKLKQRCIGDAAIYSIHCKNMLLSGNYNRWLVVAEEKGRMKGSD